MFIEPYSGNKKKGWIEVIAGSMFSGKTEELIRRLKRVDIAGQRAEIFKPAVDTRYHPEDIVSHDSSRVRSTPIDSPFNILLLASGVDVVGIDEAQFFNPEIVEVAEKLALNGIRVIVAGLDMDYLGNPFGPMPALMSRAEYVTKLHAICVKCGDIANYSYRIPKIDDQVLLGEKNIYEPRCRHCFYN
ncbi:thymidine kinase [Flavipsychrobacter stenotrophus]|uniref:Thymidine kinase n=1 Tax=Flavipsychrobacter stenotrophus TaxID=2077091 RepID=A0A2S7SXJ3_9BACT|nr:thymidine kinase [Flavipsychrobacter stenotrophus]PQJ11327.1 thymidine kinase [Flavipsychrobacter stenotrophus]